MRFFTLSGTGPLGNCGRHYAKSVGRHYPKIPWQVRPFLFLEGFPPCVLSFAVRSCREQLSLTLALVSTVVEQLFYGNLFLGIWKQHLLPRKLSRQVFLGLSRNHSKLL